MWQLKMTNSGGQFEDVGTFETLAFAARHIVDREGYPVRAFFRNSRGTEHGSDEETFGHLEHTSKSSGRLYVVKRIRH